MNIFKDFKECLNESVYTDNKKVKNAKKQYDLENFRLPRTPKGTIDTSNIGSTKSIEKKIERTPYKRPHKAVRKVVAESSDNSGIDKSVSESCKSKSLKEASTPFVDNLITDIEDGIFTWESVCMACLKYMSEDDIRDMCRVNGFYDFDEDKDE